MGSCDKLPIKMRTRIDIEFVQYQYGFAKDSY